MDSKQVAYIIEKVAKAKQERAERALRADATAAYVPFCDYLLYREGVVDWRQLTKHEVTKFYLDYELECLKLHMEYEHPSVYGVSVSLMK